MTSSKVWRRRQEDLTAFADALTRLLAVLESGGDSIVSSGSWGPRAGQEAEAARRAAEVDRLSGPAALAIASAGGYIEWKPRGTFQTRPVNPAAAWRTILDWDPMFPVEAIFAVCNQSLGLLENFADQAEESERSLAGKIERVLPRRQTRAVGRGDDGGYAGAVRAAIIGIPAALVVAYLAYRFGWSRG